MRNSEAKMEAQTEEFVVAAQDLYASGEPGLYMSEIGKQMARNDEAFMRRHTIAKKALGLIGIDMGEPSKRFSVLYPAATRLERQGRLESFWEERPPEDYRSRHRIYRLVEKPAATATEF